MSAAEPYTSGADAAPSLDALVAYLKAQDTGQFLYRGQKRDFPRPLVPRIFRGLLDPKDLYDSSCIPDFRSMRSLGKLFVGNYAKSLAEQSRAPGPVRSQKLLFERMLDVWGYLLGSTIAQHYGLGSGLLDATTDPSIAALFAAQKTATEPNDCGVIYRFTRVDTGADLNTLDNYSYWNAPGTIVPGELLASLEVDISLQDSWKALRYSYEMFKACCGRRWNLLRIPKGTVADSRLGRQKAAFIVPDEFHLRLKEQQYGVGPVFGELRLGEHPLVLQAIEDLSTREGTIQYYFRHSYSQPACAPEEEARGSHLKY